MDAFAEFIAKIDHPLHRARTEEVLSWVNRQFPKLETKVAWNQPMFTDHDTYIIGFSVAKPHMAVAPERAGIQRFSADIVQAGYKHTNELVRIPWGIPVDFDLLERMIAFNIEDKADCSTFWRK
ncbi:iron chaperone [Paenibacillus xanthanilyticus]|uniref:Iron chaperone n=1 Tax=Paenibacillus xanthanilyticus TaxID=1783531 RepID=A0ABV8K6K4_9BACL